ncbi:MAG: hypothetical protein HY297_01865, partial [Thaumarchaeota archaeon]|nr:hypothetical protein [Nitrososphaerota archaeon]
MQVVVFEDEDWDDFAPFSMFRHTSQLRRGTKTLLEAISEKVRGAKEVDLWGREELREVTKESRGGRYNLPVEGPALFVNSRARPGKDLLSAASRTTDFVAMADGKLFAARLGSSDLEPGVVPTKRVLALAKKLDRLELGRGSLFGG